MIGPVVVGDGCRSRESVGGGGGEAVMVMANSNGRDILSSLFGKERKSGIRKRK